MAKKKATQNAQKKVTSRKKSTAKKTSTKKAVSKKTSTKKTVTGSAAEKKKKALTIAVDFDGVIHLYSKGFQDGTIYDKPVPGVMDAMQALKNQGYKIYIFSTRSNKLFRKKDAGDQNALMEDYLKKHGIPYDRIWSFGKPMADIFIDDRAIGFRGDWQQTLIDVQNFKVWNQKD